MKTYIVQIETNDETNRQFVEYEALSSSEAQAYALDDLNDSQRVVSVWERVL